MVAKRVNRGAGADPRACTTAVAYFPAPAHGLLASYGFLYRSTVLKSMPRMIPAE